MAILTRAAARVAVAVGLVWFAGCSWVLDPDDLTAERRDDAGDGTTDIFDTVAGGDTSSPLDTAAAQDTGAPPTDTAGSADTSGGPTVNIAKPGVGGCELDYKTVIITDCPQTCPTTGGWTLVFDASASVGVESFRWEFSVTGNYQISPEVVTTARAVVKLDVPSCDLFGSTVGGALIVARLKVNGETTSHQADVPFSVRKVGSCTTTQGNCPSPP